MVDQWPADVEAVAVAVALDDAASVGEPETDPDGVVEDFGDFEADAEAEPVASAPGAAGMLLGPHLVK